MGSSRSSSHIRSTRRNSHHSRRSIVGVGVVAVVLAVAGVGAGVGIVSFNVNFQEMVNWWLMSLFIEIILGNSCEHGLSLWDMICL